VSSITTWRNNWRSGKEFRQPSWLALHVAFTPQLLATWEENARFLRRNPSRHRCFAAQCLQPTAFMGAG
jgi:hypothetical protein